MYKNKYKDINNINNVYKNNHSLYINNSRNFKVIIGIIQIIIYYI